MRETQFIQQNKEKWHRFEAMLDSGTQKPEDLNTLFVEITDDLSYARTFYPNRSVRVYLNGLARRVFHNVYSSRKFPMERLRTFWTEELPRIVWESRKALLLSLVLFVAAFTIGVVSSQMNPEFARIILGESYVEMTLNNIEKGDPMAVYKDSGMMGMSLGIAANNLKVAFMTVITGVLSSVATIFVMLYNGIMVGAFQYFFITHGLFWDSFLTIWIHGALEISAIVIAGGAGLVLGSGLLFPETYTRMQAFQMSARRGIKVFLGIVPIIILAAVFEGFLTRATEVPKLIRGLFILINFGFVFWYFCWLPWFRAKRGDYDIDQNADKEPLPKRSYRLELNTVKSSGTLSANVFTFFSTYGRSLMALAFFMALALLAFTHLMVSRSEWSDFFAVQAYFGFPIFQMLRHSDMIFYQEGLNWLFPLQVGLCAFLAVFLFWKFEKALNPENRQDISTPAYLLRWLYMLPISACFIGSFLLSWGMANYLIALIIYPFLGVWAAATWFENTNPLQSLVKTFHIFTMQRSLGLGFILCSLICLMFLFLDSSVFGMFAEFVGWNAVDLESGKKSFELSHIIFFSFAFFHYVSFFMLLTGSIFLYFTSSEINTASRLYSRMEGIGLQNKIRGLARE